MIKSMFRHATALLALTCGVVSLGATARAQPVHIVVIGDSNIEGKGVSTGDAYPAQLERALRARGIDASVTNAGKNGDTTDGVLMRLDYSVPDGTDVAIVSVGVNDVVLRHLSVEHAQGNVAEIARRLRARHIETLVFPTGKKFQGSIAEDPKYHVEAAYGNGPAPGTADWHLTPAGYAVVVARTLPQVMVAISKAKKKR